MKITSSPLQKTTATGALMLLMVTFFALQGCKHKQYLTGYFTWDEFRKKAEWTLFVDEKYKPRQETLDSIASLPGKDSLTVDLFLGTYCGDSKKQVPRFFRLKRELPVSEVQIISIDTTKKDEKGLVKKMGVEKIPTFVFYRNGKEIGRVVEKPKGRMEDRIWEILRYSED